MGKNKRKQLETYDSFHKKDLLVDSSEEIDTLNFLCEAQEMGIVQDFTYQPGEYLLSERVTYKDRKGKDKFLFREHIYSPDFKFTFDALKYPQLAEEFKIDKDKLSDKCEVVIDVKGSFNRNGGDRTFSINQKWVFQKYGICVYKLVPKKFFKEFGVPEKSLYTNKTKKPRTMFSGYKKLKEVFN